VDYLNQLTEIFTLPVEAKATLHPWTSVVTAVVTFMTRTEPVIVVLTFHLLFSLTSANPEVLCSGLSRWN
jgi:hypothetical protein